MSKVSGGDFCGVCGDVGEFLGDTSNSIVFDCCLIAWGSIDQYPSHLVLFNGFRFIDLKAGDEFLEFLERFHDEGRGNHDCFLLFSRKVKDILTHKMDDH